MEVFNVLFAFLTLVIATFAVTLTGAIYSLMETPSSASTSRTYVRMPSPVVIAKRRAPEHLPSERAMENELMAARFNPFEHELSAAIDFWPEVVEEKKSWGEREVVMRSFFEGDYVTGVYEIVEIVEISDVTQGGPFEHGPSQAMDFWPSVTEEREEWRVVNVKDEIVLDSGEVIDVTDYPDPVCSNDMWPLDNAIETVELPGEIILGEGVRFGSRVIEIIEVGEDVTAAPEPPAYEEVERKFRLWQARQVTQEVINLLRGPVQVDNDLYDVPF